MRFWAPFITLMIFAVIHGTDQEERRKEITDQREEEREQEEISDQGEREEEEISNQEKEEERKNEINDLERQFADQWSLGQSFDSWWSRIPSLSFPSSLSWPSSLSSLLISHSDPDEYRDVYDVITDRGFDYEKHEITTLDGYILTAQRLIHPLIERSKVKRPIILIHGFCLSAIDFLINSPGGNFDEPITDQVGNNLGFELAKRGYDVWLGNNRGNKYSLNHTKFINPSRNSDYWNFTFDQMVAFDLPAMINYVRKSTKSRTVGYIGYSQGATIMFALLASKPEYAHIVKPFVALAPLIIGTNQKSPIRFFAQNLVFRETIKEVGAVFHDTFAQGLSLTCRGPLGVFCPLIITLISGYNWAHLNKTRIPVYIRNMPSGAGTSGANFDHWAQMLTNGIFAKYDYGSADENYLTYGYSEPPIYDLGKIRSRDICLFYSRNDWISDIEDSKSIINELKVPLKVDYIVPYPGWTHADFIWGNQTGKYVNQQVIDILQSYQ